MKSEKSTENRGNRKEQANVPGRQVTPDDWHPETRALHEAWHPDNPGEPVVASIEPSTVFRHPRQGLSSGSWSYTRLDNPNRMQLEKTLASLEGGGRALAFSSGMTAVQAIFHILSPGDHVLLPDDLYHGVRNLIRNQYEKWGLTFDFVDMSRPESVEQASRKNTRLLWLETPSNPMLKISDLSALTALAGQKGWITVVDNTWSTPVIQRPVEHGADIVLYSTTKYIGGHSDALGGALVIRDSESLAETVDKLGSFQIQAGGVPSPFDCWMMTRSLKTLYARIRIQSANAQSIAEKLSAHPAVKNVYYPGLKDHPDRHIASRQMDLPGAMISFQVKGGSDEALRVVSASELIIPATSLGGVESTWEHRKTSEYPESPTPGDLIRLSVGIEHPEDIWKDIEHSLRA